MASDELIVLKLLTPSGHPQEIRCKDILEINGKPFDAVDAELREYMVHLDGRISALENILKSEKAF